VGYRWKSPQAADDLQSYLVRPVAAIADPSKSFQSGDSGTIHVSGAGSLRFDFGVESAAWLEFDSPDLTGTVEMSISEYDEPAIENAYGPEHRIKTLAPQRYGNTYRLELNSELYEGVRFGWIHVRTFDKPWQITAVRAVCQIKPTNYNGSFACSDPMITRIWYTGAYGVKVNYCKDYFGAILMNRGDRFSWTGDAHPSQAASMTAFGNWDFVKHNLDRTATNSNGIESYALYWVLSLLDYYQHSGDEATLRGYIDHTRATLDHAVSVYDRPNIGFYGWDERLGAGFEAPQCLETFSAFQMLCVRACKEFADALSGIGQADIAATYHDIAAQKMTALRANAGWLKPLGVHALADAVNTGLTTQEEQSQMFAREFDDRLNRLSFSPFNQYFILLAMSRMNRYDEALVCVRDQWGGELEYGGTVFFETYTPSWNSILKKNGAVPNCQAGYTSLAHPWGSGVTTWLSQEVLGIKPTAPGFSKVDIAPNLGTTLTWVSGTVPTPHGPISAHFDTRSGKGEITLPENTVGRIGIPITAGRSIKTVALNGQVVWNGQLQTGHGVTDATPTPDFLYLNNVLPGHYFLSVKYHGGSSRIANPPPMAYPIPTAKQDITTHGDWGGVYGRDGYILFDYDGTGKDRRQLPAYVTSVAPSTRDTGHCQHSQLASASTERRALAPSPDNTMPRNVGCLYTAAPNPCQETTTVDVTVADGRAYELAIYCVDWDKQSRRQTIDLFDLTTYKRLAPSQLVQDFAEGKYLIYKCHGSVRIRINQIRGDNAVLNALFFDADA
jgi:hypothetical protein